MDRALTLLAVTILPTVTSAKYVCSDPRNVAVSKLTGTMRQTEINR